MNILENLDKNKLHHAYLIEGARAEIVPEILKFCESIDIKTSGNPDFIHITIDNFKIDEAFELRAMSANKSYTSDKKIFLLCVNSFSLDAENVLLKMFEEPIENTHFFLIVPDTNALLKTLLSRFYYISLKSDTTPGLKEAENFIALSPQKRIDFIKELLIEPEEEDNRGNKIIVLDSTRAKAISFINMIEVSLHKKFIKDYSNALVFKHLFKIREFLRMPGSSTKNLMESLALIIPNF